MKRGNVITALITVGSGFLLGCSSKSEAVKETVVVTQEVTRIVAKPATPFPTAQTVAEGAVHPVEHAEPSIKTWSLINTRCLSRTASRALLCPRGASSG